MTLILPDIAIPPDLARDDMPDLLRHWYLGPRARRHMMLRRFAEVDRHLDLASGRRVLDVGSAWGFNVMALNALGFRAVGVDIVPDQFAVGKRIAEFNRVPFDVAGADACALPFRAASFDHVTLVETFEHIFADDRSRAMAECRRVLRPGGRIVLSTPNHASLVERAKRVAVRHAGFAPSFRRCVIPTSAPRATPTIRIAITNRCLIARSCRCCRGRAFAWPVCRTSSSC